MKQFCSRSLGFLVSNLFVFELRSSETFLWHVASTMRHNRRNRSKTWLGGANRNAEEPVSLMKGRKRGFIRTRLSGEGGVS